MLVHTQCRCISIPTATGHAHRLCSHACFKYISQNSAGSLPMHYPSSLQTVPHSQEVGSPGFRLPLPREGLNPHLFSQHRALTTRLWARHDPSPLKTEPVPLAFSSHWIKRIQEVSGSLGARLEARSQAPPPFLPKQQLSQRATYPLAFACLSGTTYL